jgi:hypothetical protein
VAQHFAVDTTSIARLCNETLKASAFPHLIVILAGGATVGCATIPATSSENGIKPRGTQVATVDGTSRLPSPVLVTDGAPNKPVTVKQDVETPDCPVTGPISYNTGIVRTYAGRSGQGGEPGLCLFYDRYGMGVPNVYGIFLNRSPEDARTLSREVTPVINGSREKTDRFSTKSNDYEFSFLGYGSVTAKDGETRDGAKIYEAAQYQLGAARPTFRLDFYLMSGVLIQSDQSSGFAEQHGVHVVIVSFAGISEKLN